jgi:predicted transposase YbfD/YdcC
LKIFKKNTYDSKKNEISEYYEYLQRELVDPRDARGKRHDFHFVLTGVLLSVLSGKVLITEIHRYLKRHHQSLCKLLGVDHQKVISDAQLRRVLSRVDVMKLQGINSQYFGFTSDALPGERWISFDGKEIRGTIDRVLGEKRGWNIVRPFVQQDKISLNALFYHGLKESEINYVQELLKDDVLAKGPVIFDALHTQYQTLTTIEEAGGTYIAQVKDNQKELLEDLKDHLSISKPFAQRSSPDKGHGRIEQRQGMFYDISGIVFDQRWDHCGLATLIVVDRETTQLKTAKQTQEQSFYVSNRPKTELKITDAFKAIRNHWQIESDNYLRDTTFREDKIRCFNQNRIQTISVLISLASNLLQNQKVKNIKAHLEDIACNPAYAIPLFKKIQFL